MALEKSKLVIEIEAKLKNTEKDIKAISDQLYSLDDQVKKSEQTTKTYNKTVEQEIKKFERLQSQLDKTIACNNNLVSSNSKLNSQIKNNIGEYKKLNNETINVVNSSKEINSALNSNVQSLSKTSKSINSVSSSISSLVESIESTIQTFNNLLDVFQKLLSEKSLNTLSNLFKLLALYLRFSGKNRLYEMMMKFSDSLIEVNKFVRELEGNVFDFNNEITKSISRLETLFNIIDALKIIGTTIFSIAFISGLVQGFVNAAAEAKVFLETAKKVHNILFQIDFSVIKFSNRISEYIKFIGGFSKNVEKSALNMEKSLEKFLVGFSNISKKIAEFNAKSKTTLSIVYKIRNDIDGIIANLGNLVRSITTFGKASTVGAMQVSLFQRILLNFKFSFDVLIAVLNKATKTIFTYSRGFYYSLLKPLDFFISKTPEYISSFKNLFEGINKNIFKLLLFSKPMGYFFAFLTVGLRKFLILAPSLLTLISLFKDVLSIMTGVGLPVHTIITALAYGNFRISKGIQIIRLSFIALIDDIKFYSIILAKLAKDLGYGLYITFLRVFGKTTQQNVLLLTGAFEKLTVLQKINIFVNNLHKSFMAFINSAISGIFSFNKSMSVGAAGISRFEKLILNIKYVVEILSKSFLDLARNIGNSFSKIFPKISAFAKSSIVLFTDFFSKIVSSSITTSQKISIAFNGISKAFVMTKNIIVAFGQGFYTGFMRPFFLGELLLKNITLAVNETGNVFKSLATTISKVLSPTFFHLAEYGGAVGGIIGTLGYMAATSNSTFMKLSGTILLITSVALGGLATILTLIMSKIGRLVTAIGINLINAMNEFEKKAIKAESVLKAFEFTVSGFIKTFGVNAIGSLDFWNQKIKEVSQNTAFASSDIQKSIKLIIAEGSILKLKTSEMTDILKIAIDMAALYGMDLADVTTRLVKGLSGQADALINLGINITETALSHSELTKELNKQNNQLSDNNKELTEAQKRQVRFFEIIKQTKPIMGAAINQLNTIEGATRKYETALENIKIAIGSQSNFTLGYIKILTTLVQVLDKLPKVIFNFVGAILDLSGVLLTVIGLILQYIITIGSLVGITKILNSVLAKEALLFNILNKSFSFMFGAINKATTAIQLSVIANNSMIAVLKNVGNVVKGITVVAFIELGKMLSSVATKVIFLGKAFIASGMLATFSSWAAIISLVIYSISKFSDELAYVYDNMPLVVKLLGAAGLAYFALSQAIKIATLRKIIFNSTIKGLITAIHLETIAIYGNITATTLMATSIRVLLIAALAKLKIAFLAIANVIGIMTRAILLNPLFWKIGIIVAGIVALSKAIYELNQRTEELRTTSDKSAEATRKILDDVENQMGFFNVTMQVAKETIKDFFRFMVELAKIIILSIRSVIIGWQTLYLKIKNSIKEGLGISNLSYEMDELNRKANETSGLFAESFRNVADVMAGTQTALASINSEMTEFEDKTTKLINKLIEIEDIRTEELGNDFVKARIAYSKATVELEKLKDQLRNIPVISEDGSKKYEEIAKKIEETELERARLYFRLEKLKIDQLKEFADNAKQYNADMLKNDKDYVASAMAENKKIMEQFEEKVKFMRDTVDLSKEELEMIEKIRQSLIKQAKARVEAAKTDKQKDITNLVDQYNKLYESQLKNFGQSIEAIRFEGDLRISKINEEMGKLERRNEMNTEQYNILKKIRDLTFEEIEIQIKQEKTKIGGDVSQTIMNVGGMLNDFGQAFGLQMKGFMSSVMSMASSTVSMIVGLILKIPDLLISVSSLVDQITNFPKRLFEAFGKLFTSLIRFVQDFIPQLIESVPASLMQTTDFAESMMKAFDQLLERLPDLISGMLERMPEIIERFVSSSVSMLPRFWTAIIKFLIKGAPKIVEAIIKEIPRMVEAFVNGLIEAFNLIGKDFSKQLEEPINQMGKKLVEASTQATSDIFKVTGLDEEQINKQKELAEDIFNAHVLGVNYLKMWWTKFLIELQKVWDTIVLAWRGVWDLIITAWRMLWDFIDTNIISPLKEAFSFIADVFSKFGEVLASWITKASEALGSIFSTAADILGKIPQAISDAINYIINDFPGDFMDALSGAWEGLKDILKGIFSAVWETTKTSITNSLDTFSKLGEGIWNGFSTFFESMKDIFGGLGSKIWDNLKAGFDTLPEFFKNMFNNLNPSNLLQKIFKTEPSQGTVESKLGIDIPVVKFAEGVSRVPGIANVPGDSEKNDKVLALLSPGEAVIPRSLMANPFIKMLVEGILGQSIQKFSLGGAVKAIAKGDVKGAVNEMEGAVKAPEGGVLGALAKGDIEGALKQLDPTVLATLGMDQMKSLFWDKMIEGVKKIIFEGAAFENGGMINNDGVGYLHRGELVLAKPAVDNLTDALLSRKEKTQEIRNEINVTFDIKTTDPIDDKLVRNKLWPEFKNMLRRESLDGKRLIQVTGVGR